MLHNDNSGPGDILHRCAENTFKSLALSDWSAELRILQDEERRQVALRRRELDPTGDTRAFT